MGYYVNITDSTWSMSKANEDEAYKALCNLNDYHNLKNGGMWGGDTEAIADNVPNPYKWFSWLPYNYPDLYKTVSQILLEIGFELEEDDNDIRIRGYDNKMGQEDLFLAAISIYSSGHIEWRGEDGEIWRVVYGQDSPIDESATIVWSRK